MADHQFRHGVATAIRALRAERRWTQRELCRQTELSPAYLSELESGQKDASADVLERLALAFGCRMDEFLWVALLAMQTGEVPGVERRGAALTMMTHMLNSDPTSRAELEDFIQFQKWKRSKGTIPRRRTPPTREPHDVTEQTEPDFTED